MKSCWAVGLVLLLSVCGSAQNATRIDGRQHPQLIPDNAAYRTVFLMHSHFETQQAATRSEQFHALIGFAAADHQAYDEVLRNFRQQYDHQVESHNAFVDSASSSSSIQEIREEVSNARKSLSMLVETARAEMAARMTKEGTAKLDAFVQSEKTRMVVGVRSAQ